MTGLIILAAGESSRLGQPKQNLLYNGKTLLQHAIESGQGADCQTIVVVLGANADNIVSVPEVTTIYNKDWKEGMASSIRIGMLEISSKSTIDKVIIMMCDQPFVTSTLLNDLINKQSTSGKSIVASTYNGTTGVPVLFDHSLFSELLSLRGKEGAKNILRNHVADIAEIPFEKGGIDIDTPEDYERLRRLSD